MNCEELQAQLSNYFEKSLDTPNLAIIETHLSTCPICRLEAETLHECIRQLAILPLIDPPIGFAQRVMAHVREIEKKPGLWGRLFLPLHIKIPMQASVAVLIAIFAVYLFQKEQSQKQVLPTNERTAALGTSTDQAQTIVHQGSLSETKQKKAGSHGISDASAQSSLRKETVTLQERRGNVAKDVSPFTALPIRGQVKARGDRGETVTASTTASVSEQRQETNLASAPTIESRGRASGVISTIPVINSGMGTGQFPGPLEFESSSLRPGSTPIEPFADYELVFRPRAQARRDRLGESRKQETGGVAARSAAPGGIDRLLESMADNTGAQTVWLTVPKKEYEQLKRDLRSVGAIESELLVPLLRKEGVGDSDGQLQIKLTVLPATETNRVGPATPNER